MCSCKMKSYYLTKKMVKRRIFRFFLCLKSSWNWLVVVKDEVFHTMSLCALYPVNRCAIGIGYKWEFTQAYLMQFWKQSSRVEFVMKIEYPELVTSNVLILSFSSQGSQPSHIAWSFTLVCVCCIDTGNKLTH